MDLQNALSIIMVFYAALLLIKVLISQQINYGKWPYVHGIHWSYHIPQYPEATDWLDRRVEWPFEDVVTVPARW